MSRAAAVIEFKPDGTILWANENFCGAMGYKLTEIEGKHHKIFMLTQPKLRPSSYEEHWRQNWPVGKVFSGEYRRISKTGEDVWISASYNPIFDDNGRVIRVIKVANSITKHKMAIAADRARIAATCGWGFRRSSG